MKTILPLLVLSLLVPEAQSVGRGGGGGRGGASFGGGGARPAAPARPAPRPNPGISTGQPAGNRGDGPRTGQGSGPNLKSSGTQFGTGSKGGASYVPGQANDGGLGNLAQQSANRRPGGTSYVSNTALANNGARVRSSYTNTNVFNNNTWWGRHPSAWRATAWTGAGAFWGWTSWNTFAGFCGYPSVPVYYDYGSTVVYQGDTVYVNGQSAGSAEQYADQASSIASAGQQAQASPSDNWLSLGVFAMTQSDQNDTNKLFQLAVNKNGVIRGNYYDALTDTTLPVYGQVDQKTQRAAWYVGDKKNVVYEAGAYNLTQDQTTMLVHLGKDQTQQWLLVRLPQPQS